MGKAEDVKRRNQISAIHVARAELGLSEDDYRAMLQSVGGVDSAAKLTWEGRQAMLDALRKLGWKSPNVRPRGPRATTESDKIKALWRELDRLGHVKDPSEAGLAGYCFRMTRVHRVEWLTPDQAQHLIECLKKWLKRVGG